MKNRSYNLDLMRIVLSIFVIMIHTLYVFGIENDAAYVLIRTLLISCDGLFYMISGYFNLEKEFKSSKDIKDYYKNKFITVFLPFLAFVLLWTVWDYLHAYGSLNVPEILKIYYEAIVDTSVKGHMWFMYPMFGMLLSTPFLSKMLHNMDEKELNILWYIAIGYNFVYYYFCLNFDIDLSISCWFLISWSVYYIAGYYYRHVIAKENSIKWILLAIAGYLFTVLGDNGMLPFFKQFEGATNMQPMFTLFCIGCFMFWDKAVKIKNDLAAKIIYFISKNTYLIYLYHLRGIEYATRKLSITGNSLGSGIITVIGTFLVSLLMAYVTNLCLKPVQKLIDRLWTVR